MNRRSFLKLGAASVGAAAVAGSIDTLPAMAAENTAKVLADRPNIVQITIHDLGVCLGSYGDPNARTPVLDIMASEGIRFTNHFCTSTPCSPSRGCIMTGRYAHSNGLMGLAHNGFPWSLSEDEKTLVDYLNEAGYETWNIGFQHERQDRKTNRYKHLGDPNMYIENVVKNICDVLIKHKPGDTPFYINAATWEVHGAWTREQYQNRYKPEDIKVLPYIPDLPAYRNVLSQFYGAIEFMDESLALLFDTLKKTGLDEQTLVVFTADHGPSTPRAKSTLYDPGMQTVMIMRWSGHIEPGTVNNELLGHVDYAPTILELIGAPIPNEIQGTSYAPLLLGKPINTRNEVFMERNYHENIDMMRAVRTDRYKLIRNYTQNDYYTLPHEVKETDPWEKVVDSGKPRPFEELYDFKTDPYEFKNIVDDPANAEILSDLRTRLTTWMNDTGDFLRGAIAPVHEAGKNNR